VRVTAIALELALASLLEIPANLSFVIRKESTHIVAPRKVLRHGIIDFSKFGVPVRERAHAAEGARFCLLPVAAQ